MARVLVVGSANMDIVLPIRRLPGPGETLHAGGVKLVPGGKGANAAVAAARMGAEVRFAGCVGDDGFGSQLRDGLAREGIDVSMLTRGGDSTGTAVILLNEADGENSILLSAGANDRAAAPEADAWYEWGDVLLLQLETPTTVVIDAAQRARQCGTRVLLDPAPAPDRLPADLIRNVDILLPNEAELAALTDRSTDTLDGVAEAARSLITQHGVSAVATTLGARGVLWASRDDIWHIPPPSVDVIDTTAAGDTFAGALAERLGTGVPLQAALEFAVTAAALACARLGAQPSIPHAAEVSCR